MKKKKIKITEQFEEIVNSLKPAVGKILKLSIKLTNNKIKEIEILVFDEKNVNKIINLIKVENCSNCEEILYQIMEIIYKHINQEDLKISNKLELLKNINSLLKKLKNLKNIEYTVKGILSLTFYLYAKEAKPDKFLLTYDGKIEGKKVKIITEDIDLIFPSLEKFNILYEV